MQRVTLWLFVVFGCICTRWCESLLVNVGRRFSVHHLHPQNAERNAQHSTNSAHQESVVSDSPHEQWHQRKQVLDAERALKLAIQKGLSESELDHHFKEYNRHLHHERAAILGANELFFHAQTTGDLPVLLGLWSRTADTVCSTRLVSQTRPAFGRVIRGYQSIANYLAKHTPTLRDYTLRDVQLSFFGALAVVSCTVDTHRAISSKPGAPNGARGAVTATHYVTNVFELDPTGGGRYLLRSHTSSAHPGRLQGQDREALSALRSTYRDPARPRAPRRDSGGGGPQQWRGFGLGGGGVGGGGGGLGAGGRLAVDLGRLGRLLFGPAAGAGGRAGGTGRDREEVDDQEEEEEEEGDWDDYGEEEEDEDGSGMGEELDEEEEECETEGGNDQGMEEEGGWDEEEREEEEGD